MVPAIDFDKQYEYAEILEKIYSVIQKRKEELSALDNLIKARFVDWRKPDNIHTQFL